MSEFKFSPALFIPYRDMEVIKRVRAIKKEDITKHPNPDFKIEIIPDADMEFRWMMDMFYRIKTASDEDKQLVLILPQPYTGYSKLAYLINKFRVNCSKLYTFNMDEYANEDGGIAPETWKPGFMYSALNNFYYNID